MFLNPVSRSPIAAKIPGSIPLASAACWIASQLLVALKRLGENPFVSSPSAFMQSCQPGGAGGFGGGPQTIGIVHAPGKLPNPLYPPPNIESENADPRDAVYPMSGKPSTHEVTNQPVLEGSPSIGSRPVLQGIPTAQ